MRALFLALILVNLVFFLWQYTLAPPRAPAGHAVPSAARDNVPPLILLNDGKRKAAPPRVPAATQQAANEQCFAVGPFDDPEAAKATVTALRSKGMAAEYESRTAQTARYWLHTPVFPTRKKALSRMNELKGQGIRDMALMETGKWKNAISLGFYHNQFSADQRLNELKPRGVDVALETEHDTIETYWTRYKAPQGSAEADAVWQAIAQAHPKVQREGLPCR